MYYVSAKYQRERTRIDNFILSGNYEIVMSGDKNFTQGNTRDLSFTTNQKSNREKNIPEWNTRDTLLFKYQSDTFP